MDRAPLSSAGLSIIVSPQWGGTCLSIWYSSSSLKDFQIYRTYFQNKYEIFLFGFAVLSLSFWMPHAMLHIPCDATKLEASSPDNRSSEHSYSTRILKPNQGIGIEGTLSIVSDSHSAALATESSR
ncbi:hypothetical protein CEXT_705381 [Caerostris extrusa]|uniref:Uncharacterized protein n=1 Tax=Caerostris extrusa TaxID=172846 RepID=A0AAV4WB42_CAEEX|nr:hypothetical protein CEXT_705381 [Caerostris extrusa]